MTHPASLDPLLLALVEKLPRADAVFTTGDRERWLLAMDSALQLLYPPEWSQDARRKAQEARSEAGLPVTADQVVDAAMTIARAKEEAARHFPTVTAPEHGKVTIDVPPDGFEPVLIVPPKSEKPDLFAEAMDEIAARKLTLPDLPAGQVWRQVDMPDGHGTMHIPVPKEAPSTTSADAVDDESGEVEMPSGAGDAPATSSLPAGSSLPGSEPTKPRTDGPAPAKSEVPAPEQGKKRHFSADQKGAILRRVVREGMAAVADDTLIHAATLNRWAREMPIAFKTFTDEWEAEQGPSVEEMEAERDRPVPPRPTQQEAIAKRAAELAAKPAVQWPSAPMERRPVDHERTRREQADWA